MNGSQITVVIPTYRRPKLLSRALLSVLQQEVPGLCIRVLDNASGDETERVVRALGERQPIEYVRHPTNIGCSANMQFAISSVETPYCAILNDDDVQLPGLLASALEALPAHPTAGAFCGRTLVYHPGAPGAEPTARARGTSWQAGFYPAGQATIHMVREHFTPTGVVFATPALRGAKFTFGDMEMMARLAERNDFVVSDRIFGVYVVHAQAWSASHSLDEERRTTLRRLQEYLELETLTFDDRLEVLSRCMNELMTDQFGRALGATLRGERSASVRRDLAASAAMLSTLAGSRAGLADRLYYGAVARIAGLSEAPLSRAAVLALRGAMKVTGALDRLTAPPRRLSAAEETAVAQIAALDRSAEALFERLPASPERRAV